VLGKVESLVFAVSRRTPVRIVGRCVLRRRHYIETLCRSAPALALVMLMALELADRKLGVQFVRSPSDSLVGNSFPVARTVFGPCYYLRDLA